MHRASLGMVIPSARSTPGSLDGQTQRFPENSQSFGTLGLHAHAALSSFPSLSGSPVFPSAHRRHEAILQTLEDTCASCPCHLVSPSHPLKVSQGMVPIILCPWQCSEFSLRPSTLRACPPSALLTCHPPSLLSTVPSCIHAPLFPSSLPPSLLSCFLPPPSLPASILLCLTASCPA